MKTPFETKIDAMILDAELDLERAKKEVASRIEQLQFDLERTMSYIKRDEWRGINDLGIVQEQGPRLDVAIAETQALRRKLDDLEVMRDVALAAIKSAQEKEEKHAGQ